MRPNKPAAWQTTPDLTGKRFFFIGAPHESRLHRENMARAGATVIHSEYTDPLTEIGCEGQILTEIQSLPQKPDAVIVYHPRMEIYHEKKAGDLESNPTIKLARRLKEQGIPVLVLDMFVPEVVKVELQGTGAELRDAARLPAKALPAVVERALSERVRPRDGRGGRSG